MIFHIGIEAWKVSFYAQKRQKPQVPAFITYVDI